jgi:hypothetical protein
MGELRSLWSLIKEQEIGQYRVSHSVKRFRICMTDDEVVIDIVDTYKLIKCSVIVL